MPNCLKHGDFLNHDSRKKTYHPKLSAISKIHYGKMALRGAIFLAAAVAYLSAWLKDSRNGLEQSSWGIWILIAAWLLLMLEMVLRLFPARTESMGCQRQFACNYRPAGHPPVKPKNQTRAVIGIIAAWLALNGVIGVLYFTNIIDADILLLISLAYSVCDMICILLFCPFQVWFLKNKCCTTCRIYNWDFAMMFTPLVFIPHIYTWSLLAMGLVLLIRWELTYHRHSERFYECSNSSLSCANCQERLCNQKKSIQRIRIRVMAELKEELGELKEDLGELKENIRKKAGR